MFNQDGRPSTAARREVDLYVYTDDVDNLYERLKDRVDVVESPHDTFYGARELIIRDLNRFWITFGQPTDFERLMSGVREGNARAVKTAIDSGRLTANALSAALAGASAGAGRNDGIAEMLKRAGAIVPPEIELEILESYAGRYGSGHGRIIDVFVKDGILVASSAGEPPMRLLAVDQTTFRPAEYDQVTVGFRIESGRAIGLTLNQGPNKLDLKREERTSGPE
jgi:hypothetical protein